MRDRSCEQLRRAVLSLYSIPQSVGPGDLAGLVGHVLRRGTLCDDPEYLLTVPSEAPWPNEGLWAMSHVKLSVAISSLYGCVLRSRGRLTGWKAATSLPV